MRIRLHIHRVHIRQLLGACARPLVIVEHRTATVVRKEAAAAVRLDARLTAGYEEQEDIRFVIPKHRYMNG